MQREKISQIREKGEEKEMKEPKISFQIFYGPHRTAKDFENLEKVFQGADIYIPEMPMWTEKDLKNYQDLSEGRITPPKYIRKYRLSKDSYASFDAEMIYNSKKPILFIDVPGSDEWWVTMRELIRKLYDNAWGYFFQGKLQLALKEMRDFSKEYVELVVKDRERIMRLNLEKRIREIINQNEKLRSKKQIEVLFRLGGAHTSFYHQLKKEGIPVDWQFSSLPTVFDSRAEAVRRVVFSKEVSDLLLAKTFIETPLANHFYDITQDSIKIDRALRKISSQLNLKDIEEISKNFAGQGLDFFDAALQPTVIFKKLKDWLEEKGIKIPKTEKEMDELIK